MLPHAIKWVTAAPLWKGTMGTPNVMRRPTILGFGTDTFMEDLLADLNKDPKVIAARVATAKTRTYQERQPGEAYGTTHTIDKLKLYQPTHGCFYLVAGSLVCQLPGLPDHGIDVGGGEKASFVVRRISGNAELALVSNDDGTKSWHSVSSSSALVAGEEQLPMFPLGFREGDRRRKMMAGVIPTANQDLLLAAPMASSGAGGGGDAPPAVDDALEEVKARVSDAIKLLTVGEATKPSDLSGETSRFILMDLADFLKQYVPAVWHAIGNGGTLTGAGGALLGLLQTATVDGQTFAALLAGILDTSLDAPFTHNLGHASVDPDDLQAKVAAAATAASPTPIDTTIDDQKASTTEYVARLVYQRPRCTPPHPEVVSAPSERFLLAPYFDPDAPARPIRIAFPFDPSPGGLRKFRKNVKLVLSAALRDKVKKIGTINDNVSGPGYDCGGISLSIPIITICAMIILFIFLNLLNLVFWWLPFVKICFPKIKVEL